MKSKKVFEGSAYSKKKSKKKKKILVIQSHIPLAHQIKRIQMRTRSKKSKKKLSLA